MTLCSLNITQNDVYKVIISKQESLNHFSLYNSLTSGQSGIYEQ